VTTRTKRNGPGPTQRFATAARGQKSRKLKGFPFRPFTFFVSHHPFFFSSFTLVGVRTEIYFEDCTAKWIVVDRYTCSCSRCYTYIRCERGLAENGARRWIRVNKRSRCVGGVDAEQRRVYGARRTFNYSWRSSNRENKRQWIRLNPREDSATSPNALGFACNGDLYCFYTFNARLGFKYTYRD
jgi:hypothetical protein